MIPLIYAVLWGFLGGFLIGLVQSVYTSETWRQALA